MNAAQKTFYDRENKKWRHYKKNTDKNKGKILIGETEVSLTLDGYRPIPFQWWYPIPSFAFFSR